jgi:hypothetical protein
LASVKDQKIYCKAAARDARNKDGKIVLDATTAFKTVAGLNVTLGRCEFGCAVRGVAPIAVV